MLWMTLSSCVHDLIVKFALALVTFINHLTQPSLTRERLTVPSQTIVAWDLYVCARVFECLILGLLRWWWSSEYFSSMYALSAFICFLVIRSLLYRARERERTNTTRRAILLLAWKSES